MMLGLPLISVILLVCASACMIGVTVIMLKLVHMVNRNLPEDRRYSYLGWLPGKARAVEDEYRRQMPGSRLTTWSTLLQACGFVLGIAAFLFAMLARR
jgi:hypothetical protein